MIEMKLYEICSKLKVFVIKNFCNYEQTSLKIWTKVGLDFVHFAWTKVDEMKLRVHLWYEISLPKWRQLSRRLSRLFQILVLLGTISDWPWWVSWQHFYSQSLPTKKLQATLPTRLPCRHTTPTNITRNSFVLSTFKRTGTWGKSWSHQIYVYDLNLAL